MLSQSESDSLFIIQLSRIGLIVSTEFDHNNWREGGDYLETTELYCKILSLTWRDLP